MTSLLQFFTEKQGSKTKLAAKAQREARRRRRRQLEVNEENKTRGKETEVTKPTEMCKQDEKGEGLMVQPPSSMIRLRTFFF